MDWLACCAWFYWDWSALRCLGGQESQNWCYCCWVNLWSCAWLLSLWCFYLSNSITGFLFFLEIGFIVFIVWLVYHYWNYWTSFWNIGILYLWILHYYFHKCGWSLYACERNLSIYRTFSKWNQSLLWFNQSKCWSYRDNCVGIFRRDVGWSHNWDHIPN